MRSALALLLVVACSSEPNVHDVGDCSDSWPSVIRKCELACEQKPFNQDMQPPDVPVETCIAWNPAYPTSPDGHNGNCERVMYTSGEIGQHAGCCTSDGEVMRFLECCHQGDAGLECPN